MSVSAWTGVLAGLDAVPVEVEVDLLRRLPAVCIVGLPASAVRESAERVRSAIQSVGVSFPKKRVVVNLAPADLKKEGTSLDLPVALGILAADGHIPRDALGRVLAVGELALGGKLREVRGALSLAYLARRLERTLLLPRSCAVSAMHVEGVRVVGVSDLDEAVRWLRGSYTPAPVPPPRHMAVEHGVDLADVAGQGEGRKALELAAAGGHHLLMTGPPGCGKSMLAQRLPTILPALTPDQQLVCSRIYQAADCAPGPDGWVRRRPFRAPHHSISLAGMAGGRTLRPGEISLAHNGVLFLDEAPEFSRSVVEALRQPLQDGVLHLSKAMGNSHSPAEVLLVLAANPCPCGHRGSARCICTDGAIARYMQRLSGPLLDRIDLHVMLSPLPPESLLGPRNNESSATVGARVRDAHERQRARGQHRANARLTPSGLERFAALTAAARETAAQGANVLQLSARATTGVIRVARTLADLAGRSTISPEDIRTALHFRPRLSAS